jgi:PAS domain S-box-containing protein
VIYVTDLAGVIREASSGTQRVLGYGRNEIVGKREVELAHPEDLPRIEEAYEQDLRSTVLGPPHDLRLRHRTGSWRAFEATRKVLADRSGSVVTIVNAHDVTDRRRAEQALRRSEERFQLAARATNDVIWEWDLVTGALTWCPEAHKTFRCAPDEMGTVIEWWYDRIHPQDRERVIGSIQQALSGVGEFWSEEYRLLRGDGSYATVLDRAYVARDPRRVPERMIGSMVDVTERRRAEDAQRLIARASAILDSSLDCETIFDGLARAVVPWLADLCVVHVSDDGTALHRVAGFADAERAELPTDAELFPEGSDPQRHPVLRALDSGKPVLVRGAPSRGTGRPAAQDVDRGRGAGALGFSSLLAAPLVSHDQVLGTITLATGDSGRQYSPVDLVVVEDLARRAAVALENCRLYQQSELAVQARQAVLGVVSHDLRNPLHTILMAATLLLERGEDRRAGTTRGLEIIRRSVHQMNGMIKDLLDASSIDAGHFRVAPSDKDVGALLAEVEELLGPLAAASAIRFECGVVDLPLRARVDTDQILRVFSNLIGNAVKFTPAGGSIRVGAERGAREVVFAVSDTGPGIPPEQIPRLFDRYWQATRGDRRGAGLGLCIAKGIVEAHGGRIWVESTPGAGTTFRFTVGLGGAAAVAPAHLEAAS